MAKLRLDLDECGEKIAHLEHEIAINVRRMGAMQAEIDHLRALIHPGYPNKVLTDLPS